MKKLLFSLVSLIVFFPVSCLSQSIPTGQVNPNSSVYPNSASLPNFNTINNGVIQGGLGYSGSGQCGTNLTLGASNTSGNNPSGFGGQVDPGRTNSLGLQLSVSHNLNNPCLSQERQLEIQASVSCESTKTQFILANPTMSISDKEANLRLLDDICKKKR